MTDPASIGTALVGLGVIVTTAYNGVQSLHAKRSATQAATEAQRAADNSHPIGNGWGTALRADVARIAASVDRIDRRQTTADERDQLIQRQLAAHLSDRHAHPLTPEVTL